MSGRGLPRPQTEAHPGQNGFFPPMGPYGIIGELMRSQNLFQRPDGRQPDELRPLHSLLDSIAYPSLIAAQQEALA